jgi:hypothetical protein
MKVYKVTTDAVGGRFGKTYLRGNIVTSDKFQPGIANILHQKGMLNLLSDTPDNLTVEPKKEIASKIVNSQNVEFGYELLSALPYAYHLYLQEKLIGTISGVDTEPLYYFSPDHKINAKQRSWDNMPAASNIPNIRIHQPSLDWSMWSPPPLKSQYKNDRFVWDKPTICICNRINVEWGEGVINYFDEETLDKMFSVLSGKYHIVYFNIEGREEFYDGVKPVPINDVELCRKYGVTIIHDLVKENTDLSFNTIQLMVMANCERFITMNGGYGILASYMGGTNIIYSKRCQEIKPNVNSFYRWYHKLGDSRIIHVDNYASLLDEVNTQFIDELPLINILIRTYKRPNYFKACFDSISSQTYPNIRVFAGCHDYQTDHYLIPYPITTIKYNAYDSRIPNHTDKQNYGRPFPMNHYLNELTKQVQDGYVILLDDDDRFTSDDAVEQIAKRLKSENTMVCWRIKAMNRVIPSDTNWKKDPVPKDISGISFCLPAKVIKSHNFEPYRLGDFRLAKYAWNKCKKVFIDKRFTEMISGGCNMGRGNDL